MSLIQAVVIQNSPGLRIWRYTEYFPLVLMFALKTTLKKKTKKSPKQGG